MKGHCYNLKRVKHQFQEYKDTWNEIQQNKIDLISVQFFAYPTKFVEQIPWTVKNVIKYKRFHERKKVRKSNGFLNISTNIWKLA